MVTRAVALAVKVPAVLLLMVTVQVAVLPLTVGAPQVLLSEPGAGLTLGVIAPKVGVPVPSGNAVTVIVKVCGVPTSLTPLGPMGMLASTMFTVEEAEARIWLVKRASASVNTTAEDSVSGRGSPAMTARVSANVHEAPGAR